MKGGNEGCDEGGGDEGGGDNEGDASDGRVSGLVCIIFPKDASCTFMFRFVSQVFSNAFHGYVLTILKSA